MHSSSYQSQPPGQAVVYFFRACAPFSIKNAKFCPALAIFGYFVTKSRTFWCPSYRPEKCGGAPKLTNMRYVWMVRKEGGWWAPLLYNFVYHYHHHHYHHPRHHYHHLTIIIITIIIITMDGSDPICWLADCCTDPWQVHLVLI